MTDGDDGPPLFDLTDPPSVSDYLRDVWRRREFAVVVPAQDLRALNMDTALGQFWHLVNPALMIGVYFLIFGVILDARAGVDNYLGFLVIGVVVFHLTQRIVQDAAVSLSRNEGLIRSIQFPRILLPLSTVNGQTLGFLPALGVAAVTLLATGEVPGWRWLAMVAVLAGQYVFNLGAALIVARLGAVVRDVNQLLPHVFRLLFYVSGVLFSVETFVTDETWRRLFALNPIYDIITCARWCLLGGSVSAAVVVGFVVWSLVLSVCGFVVFSRAERSFGR